jgi:triosephosphate isomerase
MPKKRLIAGNWKMHTTLSDALVIAGGMRSQAEHLEKIEIVLCPPSIWLTELAHSGIAPRELPHLKLGAQNMYSEPQGAYTGEISPLMVKEVAEYVIIGHSERVHIFKEDAELVKDKLNAAFDYGLKPILCIGELEQNEDSRHLLGRKLHHLVNGLRPGDLDRLVVAYEPVWAIGSNNPALPEYVVEVVAELRHHLSESSRILYGGSVNEKNALDYLERPEIDGLLVGGASLNLKSFLSICQIADDLADNQN